ncbi:hypothetical protein BT96DRAFT_943536 [Gymnopus androsaceus JB14]|uniref:Secreted protein n=1 Tax=Gymnopus androsaceus JB14 TaxID=1447944 RepID=A0A6A4H6X1_9AGAR|nr:hypothetical protein BT96DRAFT_943536 [Gymnopus androsaceus JB14]
MFKLPLFFYLLLSLLAQETTYLHGNCVIVKCYTSVLSNMAPCHQMTHLSAWRKWNMREHEQASTWQLLGFFAPGCLSQLASWFLVVASIETAAENSEGEDGVVVS